MNRELNHEEALKVKAFLAEKAKEENLKIQDRDYTVDWPEPDQLREAEIHIYDKDEVPGTGLKPYGGLEYSESGNYYSIFTWGINDGDDSKVMEILLQAVDYAAKEFGREITMDCF